MNSFAIIILAAGLGKRMGGTFPKVLARTDSKTLIEHVLDAALASDPDKIVVVTGHGRDTVEQTVNASLETSSAPKSLIEFAYQSEQLGTGHAVQSAMPHLQDFPGTICILYGDVPLLTTDTIKALLDEHHQEKADLSLITLIGDSKNHYGRIIRGPDGEINKITEFKDCTPLERLIDETNAGIYAVKAAFLKDALQQLRNNNAQGEYYLTDIVGIAAEQEKSITSIGLHDPAEIQGVNTLYELSLVNTALRSRKVRKLINQGVRIEDPTSLFLDDQVVVKPGAVIGPQVILKGSTVIESDVVIEGCAYLQDTKVGSKALLKFSVKLEDAEVGSGAMVGPFAHLRPGTVLGENVKVGNFVEIKKSKLAEGVKASHLSYLGDCEVGQKTNIGAGTITCNYDGYNKFKTIIQEEVFIGSNSALVAPVEIGSGATVGAGSVITTDVKTDDLAVTRPAQKTIPGWSKRKRDQHKK